MLVLWILSFCVLGAQVSLASAIGTFPRFRSRVGDEMAMAGMPPVIVWMCKRSYLHLLQMFLPREIHLNQLYSPDMMH